MVYFISVMGQNTIEGVNKGRIIRRVMERPLYKIIIFSSLVAANLIIWYELLGIKFLVFLGLFIMVLALLPSKKS